MSKGLEVEVEGGELALKNSYGDIVIIPKKDRVKVEKLIQDKCWWCVDSFVDDLPLMEDYAEDGTIVSQLYTEKTGKSWSEAKATGLTSGSYQDNMNLRDRLLKGDFDNIEKPDTYLNPNTPAPEVVKTTTTGYENAKDFNEAFAIARRQLGANQIFEYQGRKYGTNLKGEDFKPTEEVLNKYGLNTTETKERIADQNKTKSSVYSTKKTTKLEPEYQDWGKIKKRKEEVNRMGQAEIIKEYHKGSDEQYLVLDKKRGKMHLYKGDKEITSYDVGTGENEGDAQTKTVVRDGKVMWEEGNKMTGAGIYEVSGSNAKDKHYSNAPTWNFKNESGIEVPMALHSSFGNSTGKIKDNLYTYEGRPDATYKKDGDKWLINLGKSTNNKFVPIKDENGTRAKELDSKAEKMNSNLSNGCINGICYNLQDLYKKGYKEGQKLYVLPEDEGNSYEISNGKLVFKSKDANVNRTVETLKYNPIKVTAKKEVPDNAKAMAITLTDAKKELMKDLKINGDIYNDMTLLTLGIAGQETGYGKSLRYNLKSESSQDALKSLVGNKSYNSQGITQIKYEAYAKDPEIKKLFEKYDIRRDNLNSSNRAAIAQMIILAQAYKNELGAYKDLKISDMDKLLYINQGKTKELRNKTATPDKNIYIKNVKQFSNNFKLEELR